MQTDITDDFWIERFVEEMTAISESSTNEEEDPKKPAKDNRDIKTSLEVVTQHKGVLVYLVARHPSKGSYNSNTRLSCKKGKPISKEIYDVTTDSYIIDASDYCKIGDIPVNFQLRLKNDDNFVIDIPAPERVLKRYMTKEQLDSLEQFKTSYKGFDFQFLQVLKVY